MTVSQQDGRLTWNVAGLLADVPGTDRSYPVAGVELGLGDDIRLARPIDGQVRLVRTNRGVLAHARLETALEAACSRCLQDLTVAVRLDLSEEYLPSLDFATGRPLPSDDEPDALRLTDQHTLELETPVREAIWLSEPVAPLCRSDCPGLCIDCGGRLDDGEHAHPDADIDPRLEALRAFRDLDG
jgi:uncharacterized protein